jgi:hypothetical protein
MAHPDFEELLASFNGARVRYLIGGAHALALHARPRASKDLDLFVDPAPANVRRALVALRLFFGGRLPPGVDARSLGDPGTIVQLGVAPVRVDILSHFATTTFSAAWRRKVRARFGDVPASFVGLEDLMNEKKHFARPQDLADLAVLERARARLGSKTPRRRPPRSR